MSRYRFDLIPREDYEKWFYENHAEIQHRSPFHHPSWLIGVAQGLKIQDLYLAFLDGPDLVGAMPGFMSRLGPFKVFGSPLRGTMSSYLGPAGFGLPEETEGLVSLVKDASDYLRRRSGFVYTRATLRDTPSEPPPDLGLGWVQQRPESYRLDITPGEEEVWDGLKSDCRRNIKRAIREGIEIAPLNDPDEFYMLLDSTLRRHGSTSFHKPRFFREIFTAMQHDSPLQPMSATYQGTVVAAALFLRDDHELHYLSGASDPRFGSLPTSYLLHWRAIQGAIEDGVGVFNSDASRIRSIDRFKESFRPQLERRHTVIWAPRRIYAAQKKLIKGYRRLRRYRAALPSRRAAQKQ